MRNKVKAIEYNPIVDPKSAHGYKNVRWIENASCGLRRVGFADDIARIDHKGWFTDGRNARGPRQRQGAHDLRSASREGSFPLPLDPESAKAARGTLERLRPSTGIRRMSPKIRTSKESKGFYGGVDLKNGITYWTGGAHPTRSKAIACVKRWLREQPNIFDALNRYTR